MATKIVKSKKAAASNAKKSSPSHPAYLERRLDRWKERSGSSQIAISKFIEDKHKDYQLPSNFKKLLLVQLKKLTASGKLTKIKNSYKLTAPTKNPKPAAAAAKPKAKVVVKPKVKSPAKKKVKALLAKKAAPEAKMVVKSPAKKAGTPAKLKVKSAKKVSKSPAKKVTAPAVKKSKK